MLVSNDRNNNKFYNKIVLKPLSRNNCTVITKPDERNWVVLLNEHDYLKKKENILNYL